MADKANAVEEEAKTPTRRRRAGRRSNGEGTISQRKDGRWEAKITLPDGSRKTVYGRDAAEARAKLLRLQDEQRQGRDLTRGRVRVDAYLSSWLHDTAALRVGLVTLRDYETVVRLHLSPALGRRHLDALTPQDVQGMLARVRSDGRSARTVAKVRAVLRTALQDAQKSGLVTRNVAKLATVPRQDGGKVEPLTPEQARALMTATSGHRLGPLFALALMTGLRMGELCGLRWQDVDFERSTLMVAQTLKSLPGEPVFGEPKTARSRRTIPLPTAAVAALRLQSDRQAFDRKRAGSGWKEEGGRLVFTRPDGRALNPQNVTKTLQNELDKAGLPRVTMHALRHGAASLLLAQGVPLSTVSRILGHSTVQITMDYYAHLFPEVQREAARAMDAVFAVETG